MLIGYILVAVGVEEMGWDGVDYCRSCAQLERRGAEDNLNLLCHMIKSISAANVHAYRISDYCIRGCLSGVVRDFELVRYSVSF